MQSVSSNVRAMLGQYAKITLTAYLDGVKVEAGAGDCELSAACGDEESFSFGNACASSISLTLGAALPSIEGKQLRITWSVDETEYPLFLGRVEDGLIRAGRTFVEAWDEMYYGGSDIFVPSADLSQSIDADALIAFSYVASCMGVQVAPGTNTKLAGVRIPGGLGHLPEETSLSAVAGFIAGLVGGNAIIDRSGRLAIRQIQTVDYRTEPYEGGASAKGNNFVVSGLAFQREDIVRFNYPDGTGGERVEVSEFAAGDGTLLIENPLADQAAADRVFGLLEGLTFRPGTYSIPVGILLEPGDVITVQSMDGNYQVAVAMLTLTLDGGAKATITCGGYLSKGGSQGAINQALSALYADFARLRSLVAENAEITNARISNLTAEDITAGRIHSTDFYAEDLNELYPASDLYPEKGLYPNNGEEIIRGFEIDFESGIIRGVFWSEDIQALKDRVTALEERVNGLSAE